MAFLIRLARVAWLLLICAPWVTGADAASEVPARVRAPLERFVFEFEALQDDPGRAIPARILEEAKGLLVIRESRGGLILGARTGQAVVSFRDEAGWRAPAFYRVREGSLGLQAGWQQATFFHVLMTEAAVDSLRSNRFQFGVGLRVTSGPRTVGDAFATGTHGDVLVYAETSGVFGGLAVEGGTLTPDERLNEAWYGVPAREVLWGPRPEAVSVARRWVDLLEKSSRRDPARDPASAR